MIGTTPSPARRLLGAAGQPRAGLVHTEELGSEGFEVSLVSPEADPSRAPARARYDLVTVRLAGSGA